MVEGDRGVRKRIGVGAQRWDDLEKRTVICPINLFERELSWIAHYDEWCMAEETVTEGNRVRICGRVTCSHELDTFEFDPTLISAVFDQLTQEQDDTLSAILV